MKALSLVALFAVLLATSAFATNGAYLIGISPQSVGMGGTGVGGSLSATDAIYRNPANLGSSASTPWTVDVSSNYLKLSETNNTASGRFLPEVATVYKWNDQWAFGLGGFSVGGNAMDFKGNTSIFEAQNEHHLYRLALAASWQINSWLSVGASPFLTYGTLAFNEDIISQATGGPSAASQTTRSASGATALGATIGVTAHIMDVAKVGLTFTTRQSLTYSQVLDLDLFGPTPSPTNSTLDDLPIDEPWQLALGGTILATPQWRFNVDFRMINWANSATYSDLQWANQFGAAFGAEYTMNDWAFRAGFNWASSPIDNGTNEDGAKKLSLAGHTVTQRRISMVDTFVVPAYSEASFTLGAGYKLCKNALINVAVLYSPSVTITRTGTGGNILPSETNNYSFSGTMSQWGASLGVTMVL